MMGSLGEKNWNDTMLIDAHIHLDQYSDTELDKCIPEWQAARVGAVIAVSMNLASAHRTLELKKRYPDFVYAAIGYHPEQPFPHPAEIEEIFSLIKQEKEKLCAIGEVGLPYYSPHAGAWAEAYGELLGQFAALAAETDLPLVLHAVHDKAEPALEIILAQGVCKAHFHWLKAPDDVIDRIIRCGYYISLTPEVCYRKRDQRLALRVPLSGLLLETDGPWPHSGPFTGKRTTPLFLRDSVATVAALRGLAFAEVAASSTRATQKLYGIP
ncbi:TatD family hydrolase [Aneurinibacillus thermoaerophilus]|nr:TatD family hydrolase [Aneurinibacillus thermoaerophilus]